MATYKVIQDIEAEDKILGPLTLRQFIYALITAFLLYICFICLTKHADYLLALFLPPALFCGFFAFPFGRDQPTEVWAIARIRFLFKPRQRIWDQSGIKELVTVTAPKHIDPILTDGLSQGEVQSRLQALASTIDSRGWAVKNVNVNLYDAAATQAPVSDRLVVGSSLPQPAATDDIRASDDILDEHNNPVAQKFNHMIDASTQDHRQQIIEELSNVSPAPAQPAAQPAAPPPQDYWFLNQPSVPTNLPASQGMFDGAQVVQPGGEDAVPAGTATPDEAALAAHLRANRSVRQLYHSHIRTIEPLGNQPPQQADAPIPEPAKLDNQTAPQQTQAAPITDDSADQPTAPSNPPAPSAPQHDPAILSLANNNDLNVATLAREAYKVKHHGESPQQDEVVISLH